MICFVEIYVVFYEIFNFKQTFFQKCSQILSPNCSMFIVCSIYCFKLCQRLSDCSNNVIMLHTVHLYHIIANFDVNYYNNSSCGFYLHARFVFQCRHEIFKIVIILKSQQLHLPAMYSYFLIVINVFERPLVLLFGICSAL